MKDTDKATIEDSRETPVGLTIEQVSRMLGVPVPTIRPPLERCVPTGVIRCR